jgi:hypothetical protein
MRPELEEINNFVHTGTLIATLQPRVPTSALIPTHLEYSGCVGSGGWKVSAT